MMSGKWHKTQKHIDQDQSNSDKSWQIRNDLGKKWQVENTDKEYEGPQKRKSKAMTGQG